MYPLCDRPAKRADCSDSARAVEAKPRPDWQGGKRMEPGKVRDALHDAPHPSQNPPVASAAVSRVR